ncbi:signal peptidase II, partial [Micromonospora aurantiaca]|uniref:signal peptidase II n=1 Tax=Micromonospora aurantiaca (nom. illeg.) TaxID=47850 RepID=UPI000F3BD0C1
MTAVQAPPQRVAWLAGAAMTALAVDVASKSAAAAWLPGRSVDLFAGLALRLTRNPGAAFSVGTGITPVFTVVAVAVIAGISWYGRKVTH